MQRIAALYGAHTAMAATAPDSSAHRYAAAQFCAALAGIDAERKAQGALPCLHPAAAKVLATLDREWEGLARHREYPQLPLDNNTSEIPWPYHGPPRRMRIGAGSAVLVLAWCA